MFRKTFEHVSSLANGVTWMALNAIGFVNEKAALESRIESIIKTNQELCLRLDMVENERVDAHRECVVRARQIDDLNRVIARRDSDLKAAESLRKDLLSDIKVYGEQLRQCLEIAEHYVFRDKGDTSDIPTFVERAFMAMAEENKGLAAERTQAWDALKAAGLKIPDDAGPDAPIPDGLAIRPPQSVGEAFAAFGDSIVKSFAPTPSARKGSTYPACKAFSVDSKNCKTCWMQNEATEKQGVTIPDCYSGRRVDPACATKWTYQACLSGDLVKCWKCVYFPAFESKEDLGPKPKDCYSGTVTEE